MLAIKIWCLPGDLNEESLRALHDGIVSAVIEIKDLGLKSEDDMFVLFPADSMKYGLGTAILIEVTDPLGKVEKMLEAFKVVEWASKRSTRFRLAHALGVTVENHFPKARVICSVLPFSQEQVCWRSKTEGEREDETDLEYGDG